MIAGVARKLPPELQAELNKHMPMSDTKDCIIESLGAALAAAGPGARGGTVPAERAAQGEAVAAAMAGSPDRKQRKVKAAAALLKVNRKFLGRAGRRRLSFGARTRRKDMLRYMWVCLAGRGGWGLHAAAVAGFAEVWVCSNHLPRPAAALLPPP